MKTREELARRFGHSPAIDWGTKVTIGEFCERMRKMDQKERYDYLTWWLYSFLGPESSPGIRTILGYTMMLANINGMVSYFMDRTREAEKREPLSDETPEEGESEIFKDSKTTELNWKEIVVTKEALEGTVRELRNKAQGAIAELDMLEKKATKLKAAVEKWESMIEGMVKLLDKLTAP